MDNSKYFYYIKIYLNSIEYPAVSLVKLLIVLVQCLNILKNKLISKLKLVLKKLNTDNMTKFELIKYCIKMLKS